VSNVETTCAALLQNLIKTRKTRFFLLRPNKKNEKREKKNLKGVQPINTVFVLYRLEIEYSVLVLYWLADAIHLFLTKCNTLYMPILGGIKYNQIHHYSIDWL
jgi:hypothetical protein